MRESGGRPREVKRVDEEDKMAEAVKKALHQKIDKLVLPKVKITTIRITVTCKVEDLEQGAEEPRE